MRRRWLAWCAALLAAAPLLAAQRPVVATIDQAALVFLDAPEAGKLLRQRDDYITALTTYDVLSTMHTDRKITLDQYLKFIGDQALHWRPSQRRLILDLFGSIAERARGYDLHCPDTIFLLKTTGLEMDSAMYSRANAIIIPDIFWERKQPLMEQMLLYELFHVINRNDPGLREKLFGIIHYTKCPPLRMPAAYRDAAITNPDYPVPEYCTTVSRHDTTFDMIPVTIAPQTYVPSTTHNRWRTGIRKNLGVQCTDTATYALYTNRGPSVAGPDSRPETQFVRYKRIWSKTYCPESILSEDFAIMVMADTTIAHQWVIDSMKVIFKK